MYVILSWKLFSSKYIYWYVYTY